MAALGYFGLLLLVCLYAWGAVEARRPLSEQDAKDIEELVDAEKTESTIPQVVIG